MIPATTRQEMAAVLLCAAACLYAAGFMFRGWIPHDEGTIAQSAERVLRGELPHRDFDELYTGGLSYLHAGAMRLLGIDLRTPRLVLFAVFLPFVAAVYFIARRLAPPLVAALATVLAVAWSVPNYFASLPSWYNLFLATFGTLALIRYLETDRFRFLVLAGACGGLSVLVKIAGVYYLAGGVLVLTYLASQRHVQTAGLKSRLYTPAAGLDTPAAGLYPPEAGPRSRVHWGVTAVLVAGALALLARWMPSAELMHFALPLTLVGAYVIATVLTGPAPLRAISRAASLMTPFAAGAAVPVLASALAFWAAGALDDLVRGVFTLPQSRLTGGSFALPPAGTVALGLPYALLLVARRAHTSRAETVASVALGVGLAALLAAAQAPAPYQVVWAFVRSLPLVVAAAALWHVASPATAGLSARARELVLLLATMSSAVALIQFPYASPTYFFYAAPLVVLAVLGLVMLPAGTFTRLHVPVALFLLLFAMLFTNRSYGWNLGVQFIPYAPASRLAIDRGGLMVPDEDARDYEALVRLVREHAADGTIYAGPDAPEVYFLAGLPNPTRTILEFLSPEALDRRAMADLLARTPIRAAVINTAPLFSAPLDPDVVELLERRFPSAERIGRFVVRFEERRE